MSDNLKIVKSYLKSSGSSLLVVGVDPQHQYKLVVRCQDCDRQSSQHFSYWLRYGCACTRNRNISQSKRFDLNELDKFLRQQNIKRVGEFVNMNTRTRVKCLVCKHEWSPYLGNVRKGSGCPPCSQEKLKQYNLRKYGVEYSTQRTEIQSKIRRTMRKRYGVIHALQSKELFDKNLATAYKCKRIKLGQRMVQVQGYEPQAIEWLLSNTRLQPSDIRCGIGDKQLPSIEYVFDGKRRIYHPDIYVPRWNKIYEVKSDYTLKASKEVNRAKRRACRAQGFKFSFLVMDKYGNRIK